MSEVKIIPLGPNDLPNVVGAYRLDGRNFLQWSQYIRRILKGRSRLDHIDGGGPGPDNSNFPIWDNEDSLIMTWMWHSMIPEISRNYMFHSSAKEIWDDLQSTFSLKKDFAACYDIESRIFNTKQGSLSVSEYHGILNGLWIELDQYQTIKMCKTDAAAHGEAMERGRIFKFLHGLNHEYDPIRVQILGREKLPSLSEVFFMVRGEETRRAVMLDGGISNTGSAMTTGKGVHKGANAGGKSFEKGNHGDYCSYCRRSGHTKETCFKLHGRNNVLERMGNNKRSLNDGKIILPQNRKPPINPVLHHHLNLI
ncbi:uncharacterized protein LOC109819166 [Cajanus cajan]|uniref:uncharacterized protein LOC109819166 n=1 Tax=Cajanus cajan TaxID=3821 RepID=UPI00098DB570|nr:uncharacterized protein LOC109819166 [Cajanus cajan]